MHEPNTPRLNRSPDPADDHAPLCATVEERREQIRQTVLAEIHRRRRKSLASRFAVAGLAVLLALFLAPRLAPPTRPSPESPLPRPASASRPPDPNPAFARLRIIPTGSTSLADNTHYVRIARGPASVRVGRISTEQALALLNDGDNRFAALEQNGEVRFIPLAPP